MKPFARASDLTAETASFRQALFLATGGGISIAGIWLAASKFQADGISPVEWAMLALFVPLFGQIAFGFAIALWGFLVLATGGDRHQIMRTLPDPPVPDRPGSTAIVLPVFNEDPDRTFRGLENMFLSLEATGAGTSFDFFVLSDSNIPDRWIEEEAAWSGLCARLNAFGRIFYRKRRVSIHGKSGNVADFCRRWGRRYRYLIILDADSVMGGETIVRLARVMDANPGVGIVQTAPQIVRGTSLLQRLIQFATRAAGPVFAAGSNFWHLGGGNYWGHNAIIRLQPFMEQCVLPELPGRSAADRHILSHDTVEASLMKQAGYQVWFAYLERDSYEEGPPNMSESLKRDRRWCQGNLQHFWFLFAPKTQFTNRIHIFFGLMAYLTAPMLAVFIVLSAVDFYWKQKFAILSATISDQPGASTESTSLLLLGLTVLLLFLPKIFGAILLLPRAREFGGTAGVLVGSFLEALFSILLAPILLYFYTRFVILTLLGVRVGWKTQNRTEAAIPLGDAARTYGGATLTGLAATAAAIIWVPELIPWLAPVLTGLVLSIPLVMLTSSESAGLWFRHRGLLLIPEEMSVPTILQNLDNPDQPGLPSAASRHGGLLQLALSPQANSVHAALLRRSKIRSRYKEDYLSALRSRLLSGGPDSLSRRETLALLWDADAVSLIHREIWQADENALHPWWRSAMNHFNEASASLDRRTVA